MAATPDYFANLGVRPFINAIGPYSSLGGAEMWPEVIDAMDYAIKNKARMSDLHDAVGRRIAELTGAAAAISRDSESPGVSSWVICRWLDGRQAESVSVAAIAM